MNSVDDEAKPADRFIRQAMLVRIIDGDTIDIEIDLGWSMKMKEQIRLSGVDTPEVKGKEHDAGAFVKKKVEEFFGVEDGQVLKDTRLILTSVKYDRTGNLRDSFCRTIAEVYRAEDSESLNRYLIENELGWPTDLKGKPLVERSLSLLTGLPMELRD